ncbi:unnamed protein product [Cuscuta epithymum]|uniref:Uncharacterized protein n=1 Tax=Cuscuta epithymum TaxID=186058 RepID=A0AAV0FHI5_9ASTE|nr:unnamed protein product [Cuscuta epithymum]
MLVPDRQRTTLAARCRKQRQREFCSGKDASEDPYCWQDYNRRGQSNLRRRGRTIASARTFPFQRRQDKEGPVKYQRRLHPPNVTHGSYKLNWHHRPRVNESASSNFQSNGFSILIESKSFQFKIFGSNLCISEMKLGISSAIELDLEKVFWLKNSFPKLLSDNWSGSRIQLNNSLCSL